MSQHESLASTNGTKEDSNGDKAPLITDTSGFIGSRKSAFLPYKVGHTDPG